MFIPDLTFFHPGSELFPSRIRNTAFFTLYFFVTNIFSFYSVFNGATKTRIITNIESGVAHQKYNDENPIRIRLLLHINPDPDLTFHFV
jgi:hypothetical protein